MWSPHLCKDLPTTFGSYRNTNFVMSPIKTLLEHIQKLGMREKTQVNKDWNLNLCPKKELGPRSVQTHFSYLEAN